MKRTVVPWNPMRLLTTPGALAGLLFVGIGLGMVQDGALLIAAIFILCGVGLDAWVFGRLRSAVLVERDTLIVRNPLRTYRIPIAQVRAVEIERVWARRGGWMVRLDTVRRKIWVEAGYSRWPWSARPERVADAISQLCRGHVSSPGSEVR